MTEPKTPPQPPVGLGASVTATWRAVTAQLAARGDWSDETAILAEQHVRALQAMHAASAVIAAEGRILKREDGTRRRHPATVDQRKASRELLRTARALGLTPLRAAGRKLRRERKVR